jgi:hypothetical protein
MQRERHTAIACLLGLRICFFLVQRTVTQKRERLIELLESFCGGLLEDSWGWGGACETQKEKRKKSDRREDDLWLAQIFSSWSLGEF